MGVMETIYLTCLVGGLIYALITLFLGDAISDLIGEISLPLLQPILLVSGITAFGGIGFLLTRLTTLSVVQVLLFAVLAGALLAVGAYFLWIKPMGKAEMSIGYSMEQLQGKIGEVGTTIPAEGLGEVLISMVSGITHHMAASVDKQQIPEGTRVVVVEVRDHVLYVVPFPE
ncbi:serine protease [Brevibacillus sp. TJ4]|uniref:serine protease n=1 Tax=Brevibacillus sp. TJ4 TaxID=3234853 RepID=UPI003B9FD084